MYTLVDNVPTAGVIPGDSNYEYISYKGYVGIHLA